MSPDEPRPPREKPSPASALPLHIRIAKRRQAKGMTGQELAEQAGVSPSYISLIEKGVKIPSEEVAERIAKALDDDPELYRAWAHSARFGDLEGAWTSLTLARQYARTPDLRRQLRSGEDLEEAEAPMIAAEAAPPMEAREMEEGSRLEEPRIEAPQSAPRSHALLARLAAMRPRAYRVEDAGPDTDLITVPLLRECADPGEGRIPPELIVDVLRLDPRVLGRMEIERPFAYRLGEDAIERVQDLYRPGDWVVLDSRPHELTANRVHAVRFQGKAILSRVLAKRDSLLLLPSEGRSDVEVLDLPPGAPPSRLIAGCVVVEMRGG